MNESFRVSFDIPTITTGDAKTTIVKDMSESAVILTAIATLVYRYSGFKNIKIDVKSADSCAAVEIDMVSTASQLFAQSDLKLKEVFGLLASHLTAVRREPSKR